MKWVSLVQANQIRASQRRAFRLRRLSRAHLCRNASRTCTTGGSNSCVETALVRPRFATIVMPRCPTRTPRIVPCATSALSICKAATATTTRWHSQTRPNTAVDFKKLPSNETPKLARSPAGKTSTRWPDWTTRPWSRRNKSTRRCLTRHRSS